MTRQIVLDTETTGLETSQGHRIIEIGCVEMVNRRLTGRTFHQYLNPEREIDAGAVDVHGLTTGFLADKPRFADVAEEFLAFVEGAELIIHNAPFDVGFLNHELTLLKGGKIALEDHCAVVDSLVMARNKHPGQKNSLDALCKRYEVDNSQRELHGALLDAQILADVYLAMTGGQTTLSFGDGEGVGTGPGSSHIRRLPVDRPRTVVLMPTPEEEDAHGRYLEILEKISGGDCLWRRLDG